MPPVGFEPTIAACERPNTYALDREATGVSINYAVEARYFFFIRTLKTATTVGIHLQCKSLISFEVLTKKNLNENIRK